jgi:hypothetical protein
METLTVELPTRADDWTDLTGLQLDAKVRELDAAQRRVEAAIVGATKHADRIAHHQADGHRTVGSWLMATTNCTRGEATARHRCAKLVRQLTTVAGEFVAGRVGIAQVRELARLIANPRSGDHVAGSQDILLEAAQSLEYAQFRVVTARWESLADTDGAHRQHELTHQHRTARCNFDGAEFRFETSHGVIQGTTMRGVFEAFCQAEFDRDWQWVQDTYGNQANASLLPRTANQRRADAFVAMILAAAQAGTGDGRSIEPTINLVSDLDQFEQHLNAEITDDDTNIDIDPASVLDRRCETTDGVPVDPRQIVAAALVGRLRLIVTDGAAVIVHSGRKRRLFTGAQREAIQAIDPVCGWLGCNLRAQICDIDHLQPRSRGGPTNPGNAGIMCHKHNVFKHTANYHVERTPNGTINITRPNGTQLTTPTPPEATSGVDLAGSRQTCVDLRHAFRDLQPVEITFDHAPAIASPGATVGHVSGRRNQRLGECRFGVGFDQPAVGPIGVRVHE